MNIMYRDSEQVIHFARKSVVDGRLIPIEAPNRILVPVIDSAQIRGYWLEPNKELIGCAGCTAEGTEQCSKIRKTLSNQKEFKIEGGCEAIGWNVMEDHYAPWESYRKASELQASSLNFTADLTVKDDLPTFAGLTAALVKVFWKTRPGFKTYPRHTAIAAAYFEHGFGWPVNMAVLVAEQPTEAKDGNAQMVEYTPDLGKMGKGQRVTMKLGRYLKRHWPNAEDTAIRDIVALHAPVEFKISKDPADFIKAVEEGPQTCMKDCDAFNTYDIHPYSAYCPELGWSIAMTTKGGKIVGRALLHEENYVRSFRAEGDDPNSEGYSNPDERLEAWLKLQGYRCRVSWPEGTPLKKLKARPGVSNSSRYVVPYLDGDRTCVAHNGDEFVICEEGDDAQDQSGHISATCNYGEGSTQCEICDERNCSDDDSVCARFNGESVAQYRHVCSDCVSSNLTWVIGSAGEYDSYYVRDGNDEIATDRAVVDSEYLPEGYTMINDGSIAPDDKITWVESEGEHYLSDEVVQLADGADALREDCSECEVSNDWYKDEDVYQMTAATVAKDNMESWLDDMSFEDAMGILQSEYDAGVIKKDVYLELVEYVSEVHQPAKETEKA